MAVPTERRRRAVEAHERGEGSIFIVAAQHGVGPASLARWLRRKRETGSVERAQLSGGKPRKITEDGETLLRLWLVADPSLSQRVLAQRLAEAGQACVSQQTVGRALRRLGLP